ncbi:MAG TPA: FliM/FliN family flagellar motor switch protein [Candidatus Binatia bacterium]|nr:FliM/FliN family flagellar motor switch protein [Candidatus Binatia bacterium]
MTETSPAPPGAGALDSLRPFLEVCGRSLAKLLKLSGPPPGALTAFPPEAPTPGGEGGEEGLALRFAASGALRGGFTFLVSRACAARIAQFLRGEAAGGSAAGGAEPGDACGEFFRQVAGLAATDSAELAGGTVEYHHQVDETSAAAAAWITGWRIAGTGEEPLEIRLALDGELVESLREKAEGGIAAPEAAAPAPAAPGAPTAPAVTEANLGILLDVVLDASLRFGQKQLLLKEVLELRPGSIVELDRQVQDPAELLVAGRVIARGEVVVVDGNYGLRITEVAQPRDRLESLDA